MAETNRLRQSSVSPPPPLNRPLEQCTPNSVPYSVLSCGSHSLGPWMKSRDIRLFSYRERVFKIRLIIENESQTMNNPKVQADIDKCIANLLKNPPKRATPTTFNPSHRTTFVIELRTWKPTQQFIDKMKQSEIEIYPYSFKITGTTELPLTVPEEDTLTWDYLPTLNDQPTKSNKTKPDVTTQKETIDDSELVASESRKRPYETPPKSKKSTESISVENETEEQQSTTQMKEVDSKDSSDEQPKAFQSKRQKVQEESKSCSKLNSSNQMDVDEEAQSSTKIHDKNIIDDTSASISSQEESSSTTNTVEEDSAEKPTQSRSSCTIM